MAFGLPRVSRPRSLLISSRAARALTALPLWKRTTWGGDPAAGARGSSPRDALGARAPDSMLRHRCRKPSDQVPPWYDMEEPGHASTSIERCSRDSCVPWEGLRRRRTSRSRSALGGGGPSPGKSPATRGKPAAHHPQQSRVRQASALARKWAQLSRHPLAWGHSPAWSGLEVSPGGCPSSPQGSGSPRPSSRQSRHGVQPGRVKPLAVCISLGAYVAPLPTWTVLHTRGGGQLILATRAARPRPRQGQAYLSDP